MNVCLAVISIVGWYCYAGAEPIGDCSYNRKKAIYCVAVADDLLIRASWYDPALCAEGETINCDSDFSVIADSTPYEEGYGRFIACPEGWYWKTIDFGEWVGVWQCRDHGGDIHPTWMRIYTADGFVETWFIHVDFMLVEEPPWAYLLLDWQMVKDMP